MSSRVLVALLALLALLASAAPTASAVPSQADVVCGEDEESSPEVDADGILVEPDASTEEERARDYDDSDEEDETSDEGAKPTAEEVAALTECLDRAGEDAIDRAADAFDDAFNASRSLLLGTFGPEQLPYGGSVDFSLHAPAGATAARASRNGRLLGRSGLTLRSGDTKRLRFRLNRRGRKLLARKGRVVAVGRLKLTDTLSGENRTKSLRVVLRLKR